MHSIMEWPSTLRASHPSSPLLAPTLMLQTSLAWTSPVFSFFRQRPALVALASFAILLMAGLAWQVKTYNVFSFVVPESASCSHNDPIGFAGLTGYQIGLLGFNYFLVLLLGWNVFRSILPREFRSSLIFLGSFWLGYLSICALNRVAQLITGGPKSYLIVTLTTFVIFALNRNGFRHWRDLISGLFALIVAVPFLLFFLVTQVYQGDFRWAGHGPMQYAFRWSEWVQERLPLIAQHYDEFIFHSFLVQPLGLSYNPILPWWMTLGIIKVSVFAFLMIGFRILGLNRWFCILGAIFLFFGTASILPQYYVLIFDSANPLAYVAHSGRVIGPAFGLLFLLWLRRDLMPKPWAQCLLGAGIVSVSASSWLLLMVYALIEVIVSRPTLDNRIPQRAIWGLILPPWLYLSPAYLAWPSLFGLAWFYHRLWTKLEVRRPWGTLKETWQTLNLKPFIGGMAFSALFLGNLLTLLPIGRLFGHILNLPVLKLAYGGVDVNWKKFIGDNREISVAAPYNQSVFDFLASYGLYFWLIGLGLYFLASLPDHRKDYRRLALTLLLLPAIFFVIDFTALTSRSWVLTRFLEIPIYLALTLALLGLANYQSRPWRVVISAILLIYSIAPIWGTDRIAQWQANWHLLNSLWTAASVF